MNLPATDISLTRGHDTVPDEVRHVVSALEIEIVLGQLLPRERLVEEELAARFDAKRHVIRQALIELERIGMIDRKRNRGAAVRDFRPDDVNDLYSVREVLETSAVARIPMPLDQQRLDELIDLQRQHDAAISQGDPIGIFHANNAFHRRLFALCDNEYLAAVIEDFAQKAHVIRSYSVLKPEYALKAREEHWSMIDALKSGDRKRLAALCGQHLNISRAPYIDAWRARFPKDASQKRAVPAPRAHRGAQ
ncbi:GntR family transcriptional regulator [Pollutimonas bauzanensis]|uniref:Transcriptional regulator, GntR family n=1 Tax=Pollutimonas bauzanensis TaxID=658167 RepID=A0A1M5SIH9_9BURK|nr:GntR family transcriptional regulator [Pollutimonas bauzanensis]SHH38397.1 transcriptional regulator, GntR family [Pollutimonas bauzanensis]